MMSRSFFFALSLLLIFPLVTGRLNARDQEEENDSLYKQLAVFTDVLSLVHQAYVEPTEDQELMMGALDGATDALDPFSVYVPPEGTEEYRQARQVATLHSGLLLLRNRGLVYVAGVLKNSPAAQAGIQVGDMVAEIQGEPTRLLSLWRLQTLLAQSLGTEITVKIFRDLELSDKTFRLARFEVPTPEYREVDGISVVKLFALDQDTVTHLEQILTREMSASQDRLLLDLRGVAEKSVESAYKIAAFFAEGELGSLQKRGEQLRAFQGGTPHWQGRMVVLIDRGTLGGGEVLATILRQKVAAELVGERSFGYAGRIKPVSLASGGHLWLTDAFYTGPDGEPLRGSLEPDISVNIFSRKVAETEDTVEDLILKRGLNRLMEETAESQQQHAA